MRPCLCHGTLRGGPPGECALAGACAAALTTLVAATVAAAFAVFAGEAPPQVVHHDLREASGTLADADRAGERPRPGGRGGRGAAVADRPRPCRASRSATTRRPGPIRWGSFPGHRLVLPPGAAKGDTTLLQAAATTRSPAMRRSPPGAGRRLPPPAQRQAIPAALPAAAAALLHVSAGDVLRLRDRITGATVGFDITGTFTPAPGGPVPAAATTSPPAARPPPTGPSPDGPRW